LQDATIRLHNTGLAVRSFRTVVVHRRDFPNELHLQINLPKLLELKAKYITNTDDNVDDHDQGDIFHNEVLGNSITNSSEKPSEHISIRKISKRNNRFSEFNSNFVDVFKNSFKGLAQNKNDLASFYPLVQSDVDVLRKSSGRDFTLTAVNEILLKLSKKYLSHRFPNKEAFLSYMDKVVCYEMRDAIAVSGDNFKLNCNKDKQEIIEHRFLEQIEYARDISLIVQLKRKLASVLNEKTAYQFLPSATFQDCLSSGTNIDDKERRITLECSSIFIKDWIQTEYSILLEKLCAMRNYQVVFAT